MRLSHSSLGKKKQFASTLMRYIGFQIILFMRENIVDLILDKRKARIIDKMWMELS